MSLATIEALGSSIESAASWLRQAAEEHLPALRADASAAEAELKRLQGSVVVQALEAAVLTPAEEGMIAHVIAGLPALRSAVAAPAATEAPAQAETPAEPAQDAADVAEPAAQPA